MGCGAGSLEDIRGELTSNAMPTVRFTQNIQRHVGCPTCEVAGATVRDVLDDYFRLHGQARGYVLDDQCRLRQHMAIFIDGSQIRDRDDLSDHVPADAVVDLVQALSGG
jgi:molybdopterin synthase sulfur carrier subunit